MHYSSALRRSTMQVIHGLQLNVNAGEVVAVLGSSGSGKSVLAHAILGILPANARFSGRMFFDGVELTPARQAELRGREIALVPQSVQYLDPLMRVGQQVRYAVKSGDAAAAQRQIFARYRLAKAVERFFPFQLSGGMARRVLVSTASISGARLVIADEPTPGLDPAVIKAALGRFRELADQGCGVMLITHDIASALTVADRVAVMYAGVTVEVARSEEFTNEGDRLRHPYTRALWQALPQNGFIPIPGAQPRYGAAHTGCAFAPRCLSATADCSTAKPEARELRGGLVRCIHAS
nr:ABC transporter ATP-binding protein [Paenibacillus xerothermodurans]